MNITRTLPSELTAFSTFKPEHPISFLDIESSDGNLDLLNGLPEKGFAIVGTRYPQVRSVHFLRQVLSEFRHSDLVIVSGLARGIDSKAHELALEYGLKTIAVLGCGIDVEYPRENSHLRKRIIDSGGLVISQFERAQQPVGFHFLHRNQIIAGLSKATWVVEAAAISGTLNTAKWASDYGRDLYATPSFPGDHFYQGNEKLLSQKDTQKYAVAAPAYSASSFDSTWSGLRFTQKSFDLVTITPLQKWVLEVKGIYGTCDVQRLMNYASTKGVSLGTFYLQFEEELDKGTIQQDEGGNVEISLLQ